MILPWPRFVCPCCHCVGYRRKSANIDLQVYWNWMCKFSPSRSKWVYLLHNNLCTWFKSVKFSFRLWRFRQHCTSESVEKVDKDTPLHFQVAATIALGLVYDWFVRVEAAWKLFCQLVAHVNALSLAPSKPLQLFRHVNVRSWMWRNPNEIDWPKSGRAKWIKITTVTVITGATGPLYPAALRSV